MQDYYQLLKVHKGASKEEIKRAYRKLAFSLHPDRNNAPDAHERFLEITIAYDVLVNGKLIRNNSTFKKPTGEFSGQPPVDPEIRYKHVPEPPSDPEEFKEWYQVKKKMAAEQARMRFEEFKNNNEAFRRSKYFPLAKAFSYFLFLVGAFVSAGAISIPFVYGADYDSWIFKIILAAFFIPLGIWIFLYVRQYKKDFDKYFIE